MRPAWTTSLLLVVLLSACAQPSFEDRVEALVDDPVRLRTLRAHCADDARAVAEERCRAATEAFRRRFFSGAGGPDEYNTLDDLPPIPPSFDTRADDAPDHGTGRDPMQAPAPEAADG